MVIVTGSTGVAHVTPIDDAVRNSNTGYSTDKVVFTMYENLAAQAITANEVRIFSGYGMNQGRIFKIDADSYDSVTIENGASGTKRSDLIVARYTFDATTGFEDISLAVVKGTAGTDYADPTYTTGDINNGASQDDFPLYRVKIDGIVIDAVEQLFTLLPEGGRLGEVEEIATAAKNTINSHLNDKTNPHEVSGSQLTGVVPISKGGTGATTAAEAIQNLGIPSNVADAMAKTVYTDQTTDKILESKGGIGNRGIDNTSGGVENSTAVTTAGALYSTVTSLQNSFQAGVDLIYDAFIAKDVTPSASTPSALAAAVNDVYEEGYNSFQSGLNSIANAFISAGVTPTKSGDYYTLSDFKNAVETLCTNTKRSISASVSISVVTEEDESYLYGHVTGTTTVKGTTKTIKQENQSSKTLLGGNVTGYSQSWSQTI